MAKNAPLVFSNITPAQYAALTAKAKSSGIDLTGNTGTASSYGVEVAWNYSPDSRQLMLQCLKTPFLMSTAEVDSELQSLVLQNISGA